MALEMLMNIQFKTKEQNIVKLHLGMSHRISAVLIISGRWSNKPKFHMLLHLPPSIRISKFGPASLLATEKFESYCIILHTASIHSISNQIFPNHDSEKSFSE
ncbi:hypothetical protein PGT21_050164 [Puccinia graminis f. sp. tritici]|uniref:Uncharacterized protein n=1 Tax=Puccinia graminis f. sp. tritici TaxID=56615 RepID=A0A5B0QNJ7_PUCGR|nr:hypothetical protein PGT21_050164 [Puccinia graminis f. sp. tritici]